VFPWWAYLIIGGGVVLLIVLGVLISIFVKIKRAGKKAGSGYEEVTLDNH
jgi:hypothetical protein